MKYSRIIYLHPAIRSYREKIFELLHENLGVDYFWTSRPSGGVHMEKEALAIFKRNNFRHTQAKEIKLKGINNFSWKLFALPFLNYKIYIFSGLTSVPFLLLAPFLKILRKKVLLFDELWRYPVEVKKYRLLFPYIKFLKKFCLNAVIVSGSKAMAFYAHELKFSEKSIFVAYNTTIDGMLYVNNHNLNQRILKRLDKITKNKKILYLGRIVEYKGLDLLIRAMKSVSLDYDLMVVGDGDFLDKCKEITNELQLEERVHFLGSCLPEESFYFYKNSNLFVLPARYQLQDSVQLESWGFVVNEAMSMECPVVTTTAVGASYDLIIDNVTGGLSVAGNLNSLIEKINVVLKENVNNIIGKQARKHLLSTCQYKQNCQAYQNAISFVSKK